MGHSKKKILGKGFLSIGRGLFWKKLIQTLPPTLVQSSARILFSRSWNKFKSSSTEIEKAQMQNLLWIIDRNKDTEIGRKYEFKKIRSVREFQNLVPISSYDDYEPYIQRMIKGERNVLTSDPVEYFALTSGTTGAAKFIPVTKPFLSHYQHGRRVWTRQVVLAFPSLLRGSVMTIRSTKISGRTPSGIPYGPISVALGNTDPAAAGPLKKFFAPVETIPLGVFDVDDFESRYYLLLRIAVTRPVSIMAAINPSSIVLLCKKLNEFGPDIASDCTNGGIKKGLKLDDDFLKSMGSVLGKCPDAAERINRSMAAFGRVRPVDVWPELQGILCWKAGSASFYLRQFPRWFGEIPVMDYCYAATEGNFTVAMDPSGKDGVLNTVGNFFEFIQENSRDQKPLCAHELEKGGRYRVILTSANGLYRYDMNDVVEVTGFWHGAPKLVFLHKAGNVISFTGEKVTETHVINAMQSALGRVPLSVNGYCASARSRGGVPRYVFAVETDDNEGERTLIRFLRQLDSSLMESNIEYASKRKSNRIAIPELTLVEQGAFERWRLRLISEGAFDSRVKLPHLVKDDSLIDELGIVRNISLDGVSEK